MYTGASKAHNLLKVKQEKEKKISNVVHLVSESYYIV